MKRDKTRSEEARGKLGNSPRCSPWSRLVLAQKRMHELWRGERLLLEDGVMEYWVLPITPSLQIIRSLFLLHVQQAFLGVNVHAEIAEKIKSQKAGHLGVGNGVVDGSGEILNLHAANGN